ncbi:hypothetical protein CHS0354_020853, partial [Potamilus streckersoni]
AIVQGTVKGKRKQDLQKRRLEDNIKEWIGMDSPKEQWKLSQRHQWHLYDYGRNENKILKHGVEGRGLRKAYIYIWKRVNCEQVRSSPSVGQYA